MKRIAVICNDEDYSKFLDEVTDSNKYCLAISMIFNKGIYFDDVIFYGLCDKVDVFYLFAMIANSIELKKLNCESFIKTKAIYWLYNNYFDFEVLNEILLKEIIQESGIIIEDKR
jgi:hypothetical protein